VETGVGACEVAGLAVAEGEGGFFRAAGARQAEVGLAHFQFEESAARGASGGTAEQALQSHGGQPEVIGKCGGGENRARREGRTMPSAFCLAGYGRRRGDSAVNNGA